MDALAANDHVPPGTAPTVTFSLVAGGPLHALLRRIGLEGEHLEGEVRRAVACFAIAFVPLLVLAALDGRAWGGTAVPLLRDADLLARLLVALPLLVVAEATMHKRFPASMGRFLSRGLVEPAQRARFDAIVASTQRYTDAWWVEAALLAVVVGVGVSGVARTVSGLQLDSWYATPGANGAALHPAGTWLLWVSLPLFQFLLLRWYLRLALWWTLLWRLSRLDLRVQPLHPDKAGGLGFLGTLCLGFAPLAVAHGAMAAGWIANQIFYKGATLLQFKLDLAALVALFVVAVVGPLLAYVGLLERSKRAGLGKYGNLAMEYAADFDRKWLPAQRASDESPIGSGDIQSLADLGNSYATLQQMRLTPFGYSTLTRLAVFVLAPVAPLLLTMVSVEELLQRVVKMVL